MAIHEILLAPDETQFNSSLLQGGGLSVGELKLNQRRTLSDEVFPATLVWNLVGVEYNYIRAFFRKRAPDGAEFLIRLPIRSRVGELYRAIVLPGSFVISEIGPISYTVTVGIIFEGPVNA